VGKFTLAFQPRPAGFPKPYDLVIKDFIKRQ